MSLENLHLGENRAKREEEEPRNGKREKPDSDHSTEPLEKVLLNVDFATTIFHEPFKCPLFSKTVCKVGCTEPKASCQEIR